MCWALLPAALPLQLELRARVPGKRGRDLLLLEAEQEQSAASMIKFRAATSWERSAPAGRVDFSSQWLSAFRMATTRAMKLLPRKRWAVFLVTPSALLRWHRELVRRRWAYPPTERRYPRALGSEVVQVAVRMARENPRWGTCGSSASAASWASLCPRNSGSQQAAKFGSGVQPDPAGH